MFIQKASGEREPFDEHKLRRSMRRAHIPQQYHDEAVEEVKSMLHEGTTTGDIFQRVNEYLNVRHPSGACMYNLKQAVFALGPSGYPFERYVGKLLERKGYKTQVSTIIRGKCVMHEIDVIAEKGQEHYMVECKFHNQQGIRSDVKVTLYVYARYLDVLNSWLAREPASERTQLHQGWVITNTKFSSDAIQYGQCVGMKLVGWNYPEKGNLQDLIEEEGLHPITSLSSLDNTQKQMLLDRDIVLATDLESNLLLQQEMSLPMETRRKLGEEFVALKNCRLGR